MDNYNDQNANGGQSANNSEGTYANQGSYSSQDPFMNQQYQQGSSGDMNFYGTQAAYGEVGRPKNRFALKIVAAVFEILSVCLCNPITMILGIVGLVFACGANSCYKQGRWDEFKSKAKTSAILLWIGFAVDVLVIVLWVVLIIGVYHGLMQSGEWNKVMELYTAYYDGDLDEALEMYTDEELLSILEGYVSGEYDDVLNEYYGDTEYDIGDVLEDFEFGDDTDDTYDDDSYDYYDTEYVYDDTYEDIEYDYKEFGSLGDYWKLNIAGKTYEVPLVLSDFIADGYATDVEDPESEIVEAGDLYICALSDANGYECMYVEAYNAGDDAAALMECIVIAVEVCNPDVYYDDGYEYDFSMESGITFDSTYEEIVEAFGEPSYSEVEDDYYYLEWDYEEEYYDFIIITMSDGVIEDITVSYVADYDMGE